MKIFLALIFVGLPFSYLVMSAPAMVVPVLAGGQIASVVEKAESEDLTGVRTLGQLVRILGHVTNPAWFTFRNLKGNLADSKCLWGLHYVRAALEGKLPEVEKLAIPSLKSLRDQTPTAVPIAKKTVNQLA